jgi:hypothetical protein
MIPSVEISFVCAILSYRRIAYSCHTSDGEGRIGTDGPGKAVKGKQRDVSPPNPSTPARGESAVAIPLPNLVSTPWVSSSTYSTSIYSHEDLDDGPFSPINHPAEVAVEDTAPNLDSDPEQGSRLDLERDLRAATIVSLDEEPERQTDMVDVVILSDCIVNDARAHLDGVMRLKGMIDRAKAFPPSIHDTETWGNGLRKIDEQLQGCRTENYVAAAAGALSRLAESMLECRYAAH